MDFWSGGGAWLFVLAVVSVPVWVAWVLSTVLRKAPDRDVALRVRLFPFPRVDVVVRAPREVRAACHEVAPAGVRGDDRAGGGRGGGRARGVGDPGHGRGRGGAGGRRRA